MSHQSLYRIYRPTTFEAVVGQKHIERTLRNAVATDSVAHAYLFSGPRGTGKTTTARILAAALVCGHSKEGEPDGDCEQCQQISEGRHPDIIELDAASQTGVDNVREEIINNMHLATVHGKAKVYIIDEVHMLSKGAFNALLKTLEEPPRQVVFILCTTDPQKVLATVRSRCQEFDFHPIAVGDIADRLRYIADKEDIKAEPAALELIARHAEGGMRDAITLFEQMSAYSGGDIKVSDVEESMGGVSGDSLASIMRTLALRDTPACFTWVGQQVDAGTDLVEAVRALLDYARDAYVLSVLGAEAGGVNRSGDDLKKLEEIAGMFTGSAQLERLLDLLFDLTDKLRWSTEPRILVELTLARATNAESDISVEALAERIERLEQGSGQELAQEQLRESAQTAKPVDAAVSAAPVETAATALDAEAVIEPAVETSTMSVAAASVTTSSSDASEAVTAIDETSTSAEVPSAVKAGHEVVDDIAVLNRRWSEVLEQIRELGPSRHPLFANARLRANVQEQTLIVEFSQSDAFKYKQAKRADNRELLDKAIQAVFGREIIFSVVQGTFDAAPATTTPAASSAESYEQAATYEQAPAYEPVPDAAYESMSVPDEDMPAVVEATPPSAISQSEPIAPASVLEPTPPPEKPKTSAPLEVATLLDELGATKIRETSE